MRLINKKSVICIILAVFEWIIELLLNKSEIGLESKIVLSLLFIIPAFYLVITWCVSLKGLSNVVSILLLLSIFFYYGQHIVTVFDSDYLLNEQTYSIIDGRLSDDSIIKATFFIIESLLLVTAGFLAYKPNIYDDGIQHINQFKSNSISEYSILRYVSIVFIIISIYPTIKYLLAQYSLTQAYGYLGRRWLESDSDYFNILGVSYFEIIISGLFLPAVYALMLSAKSKIGRVVSLSLILLYSILFFMTGSRFTLLKIVVSVFLIQVIWIKPLSKQDIKKYILAAIIIIAIFSIGTIIRKFGFQKVTWEEITRELNLSSTLWESGITFTTVSNIIEHCPKDIDFYYGKSWVGAILQCLPDFLRFSFFEKNTLQLSSIFSPLYYNTTNFGYGSSFIAECYYNFGILSYPVMLLYGLFLSWIDYVLKSAKHNQKPLVFLVVVYICGELVFGVRNDLSSVLRASLLSVGIIAIITFLVYLILKNKESNNQFFYLRNKE